MSVFETTLFEAILLLSMFLQFGAGYVILKFIFYSDRAVSWMLVVAALLLMSGQTLMSAFQAMERTSHDLFAWAYALATLVISGLIFAGLYRIGPAVRTRFRRQSELDAQAAIMENLLAHSPSAIAVRDLKGKYTVVNRAYEKAFGRSREEIVGRFAADVLPEDFARMTKEMDRKILETGEPIVHEHAVPFAEGQGVVLSVRFPVRQENGAIVGIGSIGTDVTEMHRVRESLRVQQDRYERATEAAHVGVWEWNLLTGDIYIAPNLEKMLGCDADDHITHIDEWYEKIRIDQRETVKTRVSEYLSGERHDENVSMYSVKMSDGEIRWFESRSFPVIEPNGKVMRLIGTDVEVTLRRQIETHAQEREALLQGILENLPVGIVIKDKDLRFEAVNKTYLDWNNISSDELIGKRLEDLPGYQPDNDFDLVKEHEQALLRGEDSVERLSMRTFADGNPHVIRVTKFPIHDASGEIAKIGSVSVDITEQINIQEKLEATNKRLDAANRAKSEFLAHMSHELRTPLNSVIGFSDMMRSETMGRLGNQTYLSYAGYIHNSASYLLDMINDILDISKIEAGELHIEDTPVNLVDLIEESLTLASELVSEKSLDVSSVIEDDIPRLLADERMVKQVLVNLLSNAQKFTPDGGRIVISAKCDQDQKILLSVKDTGIGIDERDIPRALEPFEQVRQSANLSHSGTGLGLSLSKKLVELHGAEMFVRSQLGKGTTVTVMFPESRTVDAN